MQTKIVSMTFPNEMIAKIDESRGDVSRSRYILRLLEKAYSEKELKNNVNKE